MTQACLANYGYMAIVMTPLFHTTGSNLSMTPAFISLMKTTFSVSKGENTQLVPMRPLIKNAKLATE